jgi:hypothetical protein
MVGWEGVWFWRQAVSCPLPIPILFHRAWQNNLAASPGCSCRELPESEGLERTPLPRASPGSVSRLQTGAQRPTKDPQPKARVLQMRPRLRAPAGTRCPARYPGGPAGGACVPRPVETPDCSGQPQQLYPLWAGALGVLTFRLSCRGAPQKEGDKEQRDPVGSRGLWPCHGHRSYGAGVGAERSVWSVQAEGSVRWSPGRRIRAAGIRQCYPGREREMDRRLQAAGSQTEVQTDRGIGAAGFRQWDPGRGIWAVGSGQRLLADAQLAVALAELHRARATDE